MYGSIDGWSFWYLIVVIVPQSSRFVFFIFLPLDFFPLCARLFVSVFVGETQCNNQPPIPEGRIREPLLKVVADSHALHHWTTQLNTGSCVCLPLVSHESLPCVLLCTDPRIPFSGVLSLTLSLRASVTCKYWMCGFPTSLDPPGALFPCCIVHGVNIYSLEIKALNCGLLNPASESYLPISLDNFSVLWVLGICIIDFLVLFHLYYFSKEEFLKFELS